MERIIGLVFIAVAVAAMIIILKSREVPVRASIFRREKENGTDVFAISIADGYWTPGLDHDRRWLESFAFGVPERGWEAIAFHGVGLKYATVEISSDDRSRVETYFAWSPNLQVPCDV